jgi:hypothetical protein
MPAPKLMKLVAAAFLAAAHGQCSDGSDPGANGCCDNNRCPPNCIDAFFVQTCVGGDPSCYTCQCYGCCDGPQEITIDTACTTAGCEEFFISGAGRPDTFKASSQVDSCVKCVGDATLCVPDTTALEACAAKNDAIPTVSVSNGLLVCTEEIVDEGETVSLQKPTAPPPAPRPPAEEPDGEGSPPPPSPSPLVKETKVTMGLTLRGDISTFKAEVLSSMESGIATKLDVEEDAVTVTAEAGSVVLTIEVTYPSADAADAAVETIEAGPMSDSLSAGLFVAPPIGGIAITVTDIAEITVEAVPSGGLEGGPIIGIAAGGAAAFVAVMLVFIRVKSSRSAGRMETPQKHSDKPLHI